MCVCNTQGTTCSIGCESMESNSTIFGKHPLLMTSVIGGLLPGKDNIMGMYMIQLQVLCSITNHIHVHTHIHKNTLMCIYWPIKLETILLNQKLEQAYLNLTIAPNSLGLHFLHLRTDPRSLRIRRGSAVGHLQQLLDGWDTPSGVVTHHSIQDAVDWDSR